MRRSRHLQIAPEWSTRDVVSVAGGHLRGDGSIQDLGQAQTRRARRAQLTLPACQVQPLPTPVLLALPEDAPIVVCVRVGARIRARREGDPDHFVAWPLSLRLDGARYQVERLALTRQGPRVRYYRPAGRIVPLPERPPPPPPKTVPRARDEVARDARGVVARDTAARLARLAAREVD